MSDSHATARRPLRFVIVGAGMAGILAAIKLRAAGFDDFTIYEKAERARRHLAREHLPGHRLRRAFAPLQLFVRAERRVEPPLRAGRGDPGATSSRWRASTACTSASASVEEIVRCERADGRWQLETARGDARQRRLRARSRPACCTTRSCRDIEGLDRFEGARSTAPSGTTRAAVDGSRVGVVGTGSSAVQIVSALAARVGEALAVPAHGAVDHAAGEPGVHRRRSARATATPGVVAELRADLSRRFAEGFSNAVVDPDSPQMQLIEAICQEHLEQSVKDPVLREKLRPSYRAACKRLVISPDFYQRDPAPERRARDRRHRRASSRAACARATGGCTSSTRWCSRPGFRAIASCGRWRSSGAAGSGFGAAGRSGRSRTCRSRCRASRTCSCSTARTARSATSR